MANLGAFSNSEAVVGQAPLIAAPEKPRLGLAWIAAGEPDRAGMFISVGFVLAALLGMTIALGYALLFS